MMVHLDLTWIISFWSLYLKRHCVKNYFTFILLLSQMFGTRNFFYLLTSNNDCHVS